MYSTKQNPFRLSSPPAKTVRSLALLRKCTCEGSGGECAECKKKKVQRQAASGAQQGMAPPIVHEVLQSPGKPLDAGTRAVMEPRFGHDFSKVRVHAEGKAAGSARAVGADAYAVGEHIAFAEGQYSPGSVWGQRLLAHELTHVVQQSGASANPSSLRIGEVDSPSEKEAEQVASAVLSNQSSAPPVHSKTPALQRQPTQTQAQASAQAQSQGNWGAKKWPGSEAEWNAFYQLAIQGLAGSKLKPEKLPALAANIADLSMAHCIKHGKQKMCAQEKAPDKDSRDILDISLTWGEGSRGVWGETFRSALQSTTGGVDGPISANEAVQRAEDIADQAARGFMGEANWKVYMSCKTPDTSNAPAAAAKGAGSQKQ